MVPPASGAHGTCPACHTLDTPLTALHYHFEVYIKQFNLCLLCILPVNTEALMLIQYMVLTSGHFEYHVTLNRCTRI
jgi:hypothetical protein